jgi:hypothetical protein
MSTAFNKLGKMAKTQDLSPRRLMADEDFQKLLGLAHALAKKSKFGSHSIDNMTHGIAKLHEAGRLDAGDGSVDAMLAALEGEAVRVAQDMNSQAVANMLYAYGSMGRIPAEQTWVVLETTTLRVAQDMNSQDVANTLWTYATLKRMPEDKMWVALETAAVRVARDMNPQAVANTLWSYTTLKGTLGNETWAALESAALRVARDMNPQNVANTLWSYEDLLKLLHLPTMHGLLRQKRMRWVGHALRRAESDLPKVEVKKELALSSKPWTKCLLGDMKELNIKSIKALEDISKKRDVFRIRSRTSDILRVEESALIAIATPKSMPRDETWAALEIAVGRVAPDMNSQEVANTVFGYATLSIL